MIIQNNGMFFKRRKNNEDKRKELQNLMSSLSLEQQMQIRKNKFWTRYQKTEKGLDWKLNVVKQYIQVLNKRPGI